MLPRRSNPLHVDAGRLASALKAIGEVCSERPRVVELHWSVTYSSRVLWPGQAREWHQQNQYQEIQQS